MFQAEHSSTSCGKKHNNLMTKDYIIADTALYCQIIIQVVMSPNISIVTILFIKI